MLSWGTLRDEIQSVKWVARIAPIPARIARSRRGSPASGLVPETTSRTTRTTARMRLANPSRYSAIVIAGEVDHVMKMDAHETETIASTIPTYGLVLGGAGAATDDGRDAALCNDCVSESKGF